MEATADPESAYYQTIEEFFVSRRGDPLMLSNADWLLVRKWRREGIPLRVVLRGVADALDSHAHSWGRERKVGSLAYCAREVETAHDRWRRALALGEEGGIDVGAVLRGFADDLARARGLGPEGALRARDLAAALRARAEQGSLRELEAWLGEREAAFLDTLRREAPAAEVAEGEREVDRALARWRDRLPARVYEQVRGDALARRLLEAHGLPRLSLFHLEPGGGGAA